jgi:hypothetical protein
MQKRFKKRKHIKRKVIDRNMLARMKFKIKKIRGPTRICIQRRVTIVIHIRKDMRRLPASTREKAVIMSNYALSALRK